jgi:hypothetical protein
MALLSVNAATGAEGHVPAGDQTLGSALATCPGRAGHDHDPWLPVLPLQPRSRPARPYPVAHPAARIAGRRSAGRATCISTGRARARHRLRLARDGRPAPRRRARLRCRAQPGADDRGDPPRAARSAGPYRRPFAGRPRRADGAGDGAAGRHQPHDPDVGGGVSRRGGTRAVAARGRAVPRAQRDQRRKRGLRPHVPAGGAARAGPRPPAIGGAGPHAGCTDLAIDDTTPRARHWAPSATASARHRRASATGRVTCARAFSPSTAACSTCASRRSPTLHRALSPGAPRKPGEQLSAFPRIKPALAIASWAGRSQV